MCGIRFGSAASKLNRKRNNYIIDYTETDIILYSVTDQMRQSSLVSVVADLDK
jgi:hypothetical protein